jgi:DNA-binding NarL/FixJ family response regulator
VVLTQEMSSAELLADMRVQDNDIAWVLFLDPADEREALDALSAGASGCYRRLRI